jgi:hypothetical protein
MDILECFHNNPVRALETGHGPRRRSLENIKKYDVGYCILKNQTM